MISEDGFWYLGKIVLIVMIVITIFTIFMHLFFTKNKRKELELLDFNRSRFSEALKTNDPEKLTEHGISIINNYQSSLSELEQMEQTIGEELLNSPDLSLLKFELKMGKKKKGMFP